MVVQNRVVQYVGNGNCDYDYQDDWIGNVGKCDVWKVVVVYVFDLEKCVIVELVECFFKI